MRSRRSLLWRYAAAVLLVASCCLGTARLAHAGTATVSFGPAPAWVGDPGVSVECQASFGGKTTLPGPIAASGVSYQIPNIPNNGLPVTVTCTAVRGTVRGSGVSATSQPFPLDDPTGLSIK